MVIVNIYTTTGKHITDFFKLPMVPCVGDRVYLENRFFDKLDPEIKDKSPMAENPYPVVERHIAEAAIILFIDPKPKFLKLPWYVDFSKGRRELENIE